MTAEPFCSGLPCIADFIGFMLALPTMGISILSTHENSVSQGYAVFIITFPSLIMDTQYFGVVADDFFGKLRVVVELDAEAGNKFFQTTFP